jgi:putative Holliday junction resolvase
MRIIAIDYGNKRIGIAMTDKEKKLALPFKTIESGKNLQSTVNILIISLKEYLKETELILIGYPLLFSGKISEMAKKVEEFKRILEKTINIPIILLDERLTSAQADRRLKEMELTRKKRSKFIDTTAALILLEGYLNSASLQL